MTKPKKQLLFEHPAQVGNWDGQQTTTEALLTVLNWIFICFSSMEMIIDTFFDWFENPHFEFLHMNPGWLYKQVI